MLRPLLLGAPILAALAACSVRDAGPTQDSDPQIGSAMTQIEPTPESAPTPASTERPVATATFAVG